MRRSLFGRGTALNRGQKHAKETEQEREARKAAVERHRREVSELKRFWNLLLRGMEVKTWKTDESVLKEADENDIDGIPSDVLALGTRYNHVFVFLGKLFCRKFYSHHDGYLDRKQEDCN